MSGSSEEDGKESCELEPPPKKKQRGVEECENGGEDLGGKEDEFSPSYVQESDVGITEFVSDHKGFFAILKRRYCDFMVHEVTLEGEVAQLTSTSLPLGDYQDDGEESELVSLLGEDTATAIKDLSTSATKEGEVKVTVALDKGQRTLLHKTVRALYPLLESETVELDSTPQQKAVVIRHALKKKSGGSGSRGSWPRERGSYCQFVLYKENKDTMEAVTVISRLLKMKPSCFRYAGTKDKRAITSQLVTAFKVPAEKLQALNPRLINMRLGNFKYTATPLKLGDLSGNKFTVVLRNVSCDNHVLSKALGSLKERGFVNYYGLQRFGTSTIPSHHVGRCLVHSDWKGAVDLIMKPRPGESEDVTAAREYYVSSGDAAGTLTRMPRWRHVERQLLVGLQKHAKTNNYYGAFSCIHRNMRLLYVHGWSSYCWNRLASWRLRELGARPVVGDLVITDPKSEPQAQASVDHVTEATVGDYSIHDVVLPSPGYDVTLPANSAKAEYERILKEEGVDIETLHNRVKDVALVGTYRHLIVKPEDVNWEVLFYEDLKVPLALTDLDLIACRKQPESIEGGSQKALKVEFTLPSASYATMAIRELIKMETSPSFQTTLNDTT